MKTSKIIFISFFSIIGLFLLSLMIQKKDPTNDRNNMKEEKFALPPFSHLIITKGSTVRLSSGMSDSIKLGYNKEWKMEHPVYFVNKDTLTIEPYPEKKGYYTELICRDLKSITILQARLDIDSFHVDSLKLEGTCCEVDINNLAAIKSLNIHLQSKSWLWCNSPTIDLINLNLEQSKSEFNVDQFVELKAELRDSSELSAGKVLHSNVKTDETSRYYSR